MTAIIGAPDRQIARATRLLPPIELDGQAFTHAVVFADDCRSAEQQLKIGEWQVAAVDGDWLVLERGLQWGSYVIPPEAPGRGSTEIVYPGVSGGNACDSFERDRVYSPFNTTMAARGSLAGIRLIPGDGVRVRKGTKSPLLEVLNGEAYAVPPSEGINYNSQILGLTAYSENPGTGLAFDIEGVPEGATPELIGVVAWSGDEEELPVNLTRKIFDGDPEQMPQGMVLASGEYYWNPRDYSVRLSNGADESKPELFLAYWLMADPDVGILGEPGNSQKLSRQNGPTSYAGWGVPDGDFDRSILIFGPGRVHMQVPGGRGAYLDVGEDAVEEAGYRAGDNDTWSDGEYDFSGASISYPLEVRFRRDDARFRVDVGAVNVLDEAAGPKGGLVLGVGSPALEGVSWLGFEDAAERDLHLFGTGEFGVFRSVAATLQPASELRIPNEYVVAAVRNESAQADMVPGASGRLGYVVDDGKLRFRREAEGDLVRATLEPTGSGPSPPGFAFRTFDGQGNFSEIDTDAQAATGLPIATTNQATNRANWHDRIRVSNPFGVDVAVGDIVEGYRSVGFMPSGASASFELDELGNEESDWSALAGSDYRWNGYAGILLLRDTLDLPDVFCVRGTFARRYRSGHHAEFYEELRSAVEALDESFSTTGALGGGSIGFHGDCVQIWGPQNYGERTYPDSGGCRTWWPENHTWGLSRGGVWARWVWDNINETYRVKSLGHWWSQFQYRDLFLRTPPSQNSVQEINNEGLICSPQIPVRESHWTIVEGEGQYTVHPFGPATTDIFHFGSEYPNPDIGGSTVGPYTVKSSSCNLVGRRLDPGKLIYRLPRGSSIVEAWCPIRFSGLKERHWVWEGFSNSDGEGWLKITVNGRVLWWQYNGDAFEGSGPPPGWTPDTYLDFVDGAQNVSLDIVGARYDSRRANFGNNSAEQEFVLPSRRLQSGFGGLSVNPGSSASNNQWAMANVTRAFRTLYSLNDSATQEVHLVPSLGQPTSSTDPEGLGNYLQGLMNSASLTFTDNFPESSLSGTASGRIVFFNEFEIGPALIRFRIGTTSKVYQLRIPADYLAD